MKTARKRFRQLKNFLDNETPQVRDAAIQIIKALDKLPNKKAKANVIKKAFEQLPPPALG